MSDCQHWHSKEIYESDVGRLKARIAELEDRLSRIAKLAGPPVAPPNPCAVLGAISDQQHQAAEAQRKALLGNSSKSSGLGGGLFDGLF